jgi:hypothetical protein
MRRIVRGIARVLKGERPEGRSQIPGGDSYHGTPSEPALSPPKGVPVANEKN